MAAINFTPSQTQPKPTRGDCKSILLIDCNAIGYAAMYQPELARMTHKGESTSAIHGLPVSIYGLMKRFPDAMPLLLWDGSCQWRYDLYPGYKSKRDDDELKVAIRESYKKQSVGLRVMMMNAGFPTVSHKEMEADDLAGIICRNIPDDINIIMATHDLDWVQGIKENVEIFDVRNKRTINLDLLKSEELNNKDGVVVCPETYLTAKCMSGDSSDTIDGVKGIGIKTAIKVLLTYGSFEKLWDSFDAGDPIKGAKLLSMTTAEARETYAFNRKLMDWRKGDVPLEITHSMWKQDVVESQRIAMGYGLNQVAQSLAYKLPQDKWGEVLRYVESALDYDAERDQPRSSMMRHGC